MALALTRPRSKALGYCAVACIVVAFSLGSTLVKRSGAPGTVVAFWRLLGTSILWNAVLGLRERRISWSGVRRVWLPGVLFGANITVFFIGATKNSVANAELLGALSPFLVVPLGAHFFGERLNPRAFVFGLLAFAGVTLVLFTAPSRGDASTLGNILCGAATVSFAAYVVNTRRLRGDMDVVTFMATITPIALLTMAPYALSQGHLTQVSGRGWFYISILIFLTGMGAHGLMVFAQSIVPIGTISVASISQPALAAVWSFVLIGERLHGLQIVGLFMALGGVLAFVVANQRQTT